MITHLVLGSNDVERSRAFYDAVLVPLDYAPAAQPQGATRLFYTGPGKTPIGVGHPENGEPASASNGGMIGLGAADMAAVDAFHAAGTAQGGTCGGPPGHRPQAPGKAYGAYLRDPDGNKLSAFCQMPD